MKKMTALLITLTIIATLAGCAGGGTEPKVAKIVTVELEENTTTGYTWSYTADNDGILKEIGSVSVEGDGAAEGNVGAPGKHVYTFEIVKDGTVTLTFEYKRDWEGGEHGQTYTETYEIKDFVATLTASSGSKSLDAEAPSESDDTVYLRINKVESKDGAITVNAVYMKESESDDEEALFEEIDGNTVTFTLSSQAKILFSEDLGPQTEEISSDDFAERFSYPGSLYTAVINGDIIESLEFCYTP